MLRSSIHIRSGLVILFLAACAEPAEDERAGSVVRDSAGIRIVENAAPAWEADSEWRLGEAPLLDIGRLDGPDETQFFRVSSGTRLSDGSFVIGSFGSNDLRRFAADGAHLWTVGREGEGPGEFVGLTSVVAGPGDTLTTYDFRQRRISRFAPDGSLVDARPLEGNVEDGFAFVEALLPDGRAVYTLRVFGGAGGPPPEGEIRRDTVGVHISGAPGDPVVDVGSFPGPEMVVLHSGETDGGFNITISSPAFGRSTEIAADPAGVWIGDTERFEIRRYGPEGALQSLVRRHFESVDVDDALIRAAMQEELDGADDDDERRMIRKRWEDVPVAPTLPAYDAMAVDRSGNLWVREYEIPGAAERTWSVFTVEGTWLGDVAFPDRFSPLEIGDDYVLGRYGDELDVEHIQLWELAKPST